MNATKPYRVLFVCMGNICRSPAGENIFRHYVTQKGLSDSILIDSAGTLDYHQGCSPDPRMLATLHNRNIPTSGKARPFTRDDYVDFDLILTMDNDNYRHVIGLSPDEEHKEKVIPFSRFCQSEKFQIEEVPDPYYGGDAGFEFVVDMLEDGCCALLEYIEARRSRK